MAMIDYGCLIKKNGKLIAGQDIFTEAIKTVGFTNDVLNNCHACCGDKDLVFWFYKDFMRVYDSEMKELLSVGYDSWNYYSCYRNDSMTLKDYEREKMVMHQRYSLEKEVNGIKLKFKRLDEGNRYKLRFWYKNDLYEVIYGYGVDNNLDYFYGLAENKKAYIRKWLGEGNYSEK